MDYIVITYAYSIINLGEKRQKILATTKKGISKRNR